MWIVVVLKEKVKKKIIAAPGKTFFYNITIARLCKLSLMYFKLMKGNFKVLENP